MTVMEHLKAAGFDIEHAEHCYGNGAAECEEVEIDVKKCRASYHEILIVTARAIVPWTDGSMRPYPDGWGGADSGYTVTAYLRGDVA